jgi:hypothetical protein
MSDAKPKEDWSKPAAMAIEKGGYIGEPQRGRYGPVFPKTPACYGFSIMAKIIPRREPVFREYAKALTARTFPRARPTTVSSAASPRS